MWVAEWQGVRSDVLGPWGVVALNYNNIIKATYIGWSIANSLTQHVLNCIYFWLKVAVSAVVLRFQRESRIGSKGARVVGAWRRFHVQGSGPRRWDQRGRRRVHLVRTHLPLLQGRCCLFRLSDYVPREHNSSFRIGGQPASFSDFFFIRLARERAVHWGFGPLKFMLLISKVFKTWWVISDVCSL